MSSGSGDSWIPNKFLPEGVAGFRRARAVFVPVPVPFVLVAGVANCPAGEATSTEEEEARRRVRDRDCVFRLRRVFGSSTVVSRQSGELL